MNSSRDTCEDRERIYLALTCQGLVSETLRAELHALLVRYSWKSHDHRAVFDALAGWRAEPKAMRADLPSRLTRLGFPDTDIDEYFAPIGVTAETALGWLRAEIASDPAREVGRTRDASESRAARSK
jgi:hypothetical protein